jgi:acryloyl-coenzyme A reductase
MSTRIRLLETGWAKDLLVEQFQQSQPGASEILVEVEACGVCHRDLLDRAGRFPFLQTPITPGHEVVGRVAAVGADITQWQVGDRVGTMHRDFCGECRACARGALSLCDSAAWVLGLMVDGGYADSVLVPAAALFSIPEAVPASHAAVMHCTFGTAYRNMVTIGGLKSGEKVVITGANGGVGAAAVQLANRLGAEVVAVVRSEGFEEYLRGLGAHQVICSPDNRFHKVTKTGGADLILDCVGAATFNASIRCLSLGGRLAVVGNIDPTRAELNLGYVIVHGLTIFSAGGATPKDMAAVFDLNEAQPFLVPIHRTLGLHQADAAQRAVRQGGLRGRIVLMPTPREDIS